MKNYLEEEYLVKDNYDPVYTCSCGRFYTSKDSLPAQVKNCICGKKIGGIKNNSDNPEKCYAIYYDENQKNFIQKRKANSINNNFKLKGLDEFKDEYILKKVIDNCENLDKLILLDNPILNDESFPEIFVKFIFLSLIFIEYKIGLIESNDIKELNPDTLFDKLVKINKIIEEYISTKNINFTHFLNYVCEQLFNFIKSTDFIREKNKIFNIIKELIKNLEQKYKNPPEDQEFNNLEINLLTPLAYDEKFNNGNFKYLLTAVQYPNLDLLKKALSSYSKKSLPILKSFISLDTKKFNIEHLSHIEIINDFINSFAEKTRNLITRKSAKNETIEDYLSEIRKSSIHDENNIYLIDKQFEDFSSSYENINNECITRDSEVIKILNDDKIKGEETVINKLYSHLIEIQNYFLNKIIEEYNNRQIDGNEDIIIKNDIEKIKKEKCIQLCTKADIFSFKVFNIIILYFEELFSFYSLKNIFNSDDSRIDYSKYSEIKFKLNMIEKELVNIILTGKKLFSKKQITYKFYLDPYEVEEKTKKFEKFTELYKKENLTEEEKVGLANVSKLQPNLKRIILPNLETLIFYLIQENNYQGTHKIGQIKLNSNLYIDNRFFQLFNNFNKFTINKLISIYEYLEEVLFDFIKDRYIIPEFQKKIPFEYEQKLDKFYDEEPKRELKNNLLTSLLIKFVCRYLPNISEESKSRDLFEMVREKNIYLPDKMQLELKNLTNNNLGAKLVYAVEITKYFKKKINLGKGANEKKIEENKDDDKKKNPVPKPEEKEPEVIDDDDDDEDRGL